MTNQKATDKINNIMKPNHLSMIEFFDADKVIMLLLRRLLQVNMLYHTWATLIETLE